MYPISNISYIATENAPDGEYNENEQTKPLLEKHHQQQRDTVTTAYEKSNNYRKKNSDESIKQRTTDISTVRNVEGIELANDAVCPFGLAKNLEKQICIIPSRKKSKCPMIWFTRIPFSLFPIIIFLTALSHLNKWNICETMCRYACTADQNNNNWQLHWFGTLIPAELLCAVYLILTKMSCFAIECLVFWSTGMGSIAEVVHCQLDTNLVMHLL